MKKNILYGILFGTSASLWWGVIGVFYFKFVSFAGPIELVVHRTIWTSFLLLVTTTLYSKWHDVIIILKDLKKLITVEDAHRAFDLCHQYGMRTYANMMINMPGETEEDLALSQKLLERIKPTWLGFGVTQPYPGTALNAKVPKIDKKEYHLLDRMFPPEKWRLAKHKMDLRKVLEDCMLKNKLLSLFEKSFLIAGSDYWKKIFTSKHRFKYIYYILRSFLGPPVIYLRFRWESYKYSHRTWNPSAKVSK